MATTQFAYDLVLKGGTLLDPGQNIHDRRDIAFKDGKVVEVVEVAERIDVEGAETSSGTAQVVDVTGKLVTPGFIDLPRPLLPRRNQHWHQCR